MRNRSAKFIICFLLLTLLFTAQEKPAEELLFTPSRYVKIISIERFNKLALRTSEWIRLFQQHKNPHTYISRQDTATQALTEFVHMVHGRYMRYMIAFRRQNEIVLFEVLNPSVSADYENIKMDRDITGDGINEVFIYYDKSYSNSHSYGDSWGSVRTLEIWDPVKQMKLLEEKTGGGGRSWNMCTGKASSYSNSKEYTFFTGGFSITEHTYISKEGEEDRNRETKGPVYLYAENGFVLDRSKDCCTLHLKDENDIKELKSEYLRLKNENKSLPACCLSLPGGLNECMRIIFSKINKESSVNTVLEFLGPPDLDSTSFPAELANYATDPYYKENTRFWNYQIRPNDYLYFIIRKDKVLTSGWYN